MSKRAPREIPFSVVKQTFQLASYYFGAEFCPAVWRKDNGTYGIRVVKSVTMNGSSINRSYDYFTLAEDGTVEVAPRGWAKDFKPGRITGIDAAVAKYSAPDSSTVRMVL